MNSTSYLSQPLTLLPGVVLPNRLVKSAMSEALGTVDNAPTQQLVNLYSRWAKGGIGLSITGNVMIDARALGEPNNVVVEDERHLERLKQWAGAGKECGSHIWMQINHPGKQAPIGLNRETVAPSAIPFRPEMARFFAVPRELTPAEIEEIIIRWGKTAAVALKAGFSGVQIHGAHGYLVSQFLSPHHNRRTDSWGGSAEKRRCFVLAVLSEIRKQVGPNFPIGIKLNSADFQKGGFTEEESIETIIALAEAGINLIEISGGTYEAPAMTGLKRKESTQLREAYFMEFAEKSRRSVKVPLLLTGGFRTLQGMSQALSSGAVDLVGLARPLAIEPDLPLRLLSGQEALHTLKPIRTGLKIIDKMAFMEVAWYTRQLHRMGYGADPKPNESGFFSFLSSMWGRGLSTFKTKRLRA